MLRYLSFFHAFCASYQQTFKHCWIIYQNMKKKTEINKNWLAQQVNQSDPNRSDTIRYETEWDAELKPISGGAFDNFNGPRDLRAGGSGMATGAWGLPASYAMYITLSRCCFILCFLQSSLCVCVLSCDRLRLCLRLTCKFHGHHVGLKCYLSVFEGERESCCEPNCDVKQVTGLSLGRGEANNQSTYLHICTWESSPRRVV